MTAIEVAGLSKRFGGLRAVDDVSLAVAPGERRVLIGPNGAGKTTLFHCITGMMRPTTGRIALFGDDVTALPENRRTALGMGRTFQISNVFTDLTAVENLSLAALGTAPAKWTMRRPLTAFSDLRERALAGLAEVGLDPARGDDPVRRLSYGERRQLELALALACRPKVLFLDEPCAGLSPSERQRFVALVQGLPRTVTIVMIEHDMDVALGLADQVTVLHHGRVILDGTPDRVRTDPEVREIYFGNA
ncbi:MAG: ABC transporter ATP-binding protein [Alphaproteobacteria bacterium]